MPKHNSPVENGAEFDLAVVTDAGEVGLTSNTPDPQTESAVTDLQYQQMRERVRALGLKNKSDEEDIAARRKFAERIFRLTVRWLVFVAATTILSSKPFGIRILSLDTSVLLALVGSVSVNVLGFFAGVIGYLFPKRK